MDDRDPLFDALQGWCILAAFGALCAPAPWSPFAGAPDAVGLGTGYAALLAVPALIVALVRVAFGHRPGVPLAYPALLLVAGVAAAGVAGAADTFQAWRTTLALLAASGFVAAGASLSDAGRRVVQRGFPFATLALLGSALVERELTGTLGNTGDLSEAALPGAVLGAGAFLNAANSLAFGGFAAVFAYALYVGLVPVYAGIGGLGAAAVFALAASAFGRSGGEGGRQSAARRARLLLITVLVAVVTAGIAGVAERTPSDDGPSTAQETEPESARTAPDDAADPLLPPGAPLETGGFEFRRLTWARVPALVADHGALGAGPGQFAAAFPRYRDPREIELSTHQRREPTPVEVEHAHSEPLTVLAELGYVGGGAFALFLLIVLVQAARSIAANDTTRRDFGTAAVALLFVSLVNAPLLYGVASQVAAFVVFGVVLAHRPSEGTRRVTDVIGLAVPTLFLVLTAQVAWSFVEHGRVLRRIPDAYIRLADGREQLDPDRLGPILDAALDARSDSTLALEKKAQLLRRVGAPAKDQSEVLAGLLARRPDSVAALQNAGALAARGGDVDRAASLLDRALELDPGSPGLQLNQLRLAADLRDPERARAAINTLRAAGRATAERLGSQARELLLGGRLETAAPILAAYREVQGLPALDLGDLNALNGARRDDDPRFALAFEAAYRMALAGSMLEAGEFQEAGFSARFARQKADDTSVDLGAIRLRQAAALAGEGRSEDAQAILDEGPIARVDLERMSAAARSAFLDAGVDPFPSETLTPR